jgi:hypothetical protein
MRHIVIVLQDEGEFDILENSKVVLMGEIPNSNLLPQLRATLQPVQSKEQKERTKILLENAKKKIEENKIVKKCSVKKLDFDGKVDLELYNNAVMIEE